MLCGLSSGVHVVYCKVFVRKSRPKFLATPRVRYEFQKHGGVSSKCQVDKRPNETCSELGEFMPISESSKWYVRRRYQIEYQKSNFTPPKFHQRLDPLELL